MSPGATYRIVPRLLVLISVAFYSLLSVLSPAAAGAGGDVQEFFFPWVPNGDEINSVGPWYGKLSFQNLDVQTCAVSIYVGRTGSWLKTAQLSISAGSSRSISANSLAIPSPGAPVRLEALCPLTASLKMVTPDSRRSPWSDGADVVSGYTGLSGTDVNAAESESGNWIWFLPIVQTNSGWNSIIRVTNFNETAGIDYRVRLYSSDNVAGEQGAVATIESSLSPGSSVAIDVLEEIGVEGWVGFAEIVADGPVGAFTLRSKPSTHMAVTNMATSGVPEPAAERYLLAAPLLFTAYNGWNTGINLANLADEWADVKIRYFAVAGGLEREVELRIAPRTMQYLYTPNNVDEAGFVGSAMIESNQPITRSDRRSEI